ncbi:MAG: MFS transporter, partial [Cyanobacteria bacterium P01_F01_bin.42]
KIGFDYIRQNVAIRSAVIQLTMLFSIMAALAVLVVRLAEILPEIKTSQFGFLLTAGGLGMTCSLLFLSAVGDRYPRRVLDRVGSAILAASLFGMAFSIHSLSISLLLLLGIGVGAALIGVPMQTIIQEKTPEDMRGKVFGLQNNLINIALSLPLALAGIAETWLGIRAVFLGLGTIAVTSGLINWYISRTQVTP